MKTVTTDEKVKELLSEFSAEKAIDVCDAMIDVSEEIKPNYLQFWKDVRKKLLRPYFDELIRGIHIDRANWEHILKTGEINGTLLLELRRILIEAHENR